MGRNREMTGVNQDVARQLITTLIERAGNRDLNDILEVVAPLPSPGCPLKVVEGTQESRALQQLAHDNPKLKFNELGKSIPSQMYKTNLYIGIPLARSTIERIMLTHNDPPISRKVEQYKPVLDADLTEWRVEFCVWALKELEKGALFVNSDETYHSIGGHPHKKQKISCWKGEPAEAMAVSAEDVKFTYMFWGGCCEDCSIPRPFFI